MDNYIIIGIITVIVAVGIHYTVKHFKGEGGCCSGGSLKLKKKKLKNVRYTKTFTVSGMHCEHCKGRVNLKKGELTVSYADDISDEIIIAKIERAGYGASIK